MRDVTYRTITIQKKRGGISFIVSTVTLYKETLLLTLGTSQKETSVVGDSNIHVSETTAWVAGERPRGGTHPEPRVDLSRSHPSLLVTEKIHADIGLSRWLFSAAGLLSI